MQALERGLWSKNSNRFSGGKMKHLIAVVLLALTFACASLSNKESYVKLQKETETTCVYGRHGTQTDDHSDFAVSKKDLGLGANEKCAEWVTEVCENATTKMAMADGADGQTVMRTTYRCERNTINGRVIKLLRP